MKKEKQSCNFGIKKFNEHKRDKEFVKEIREKEKKAKKNKYECPEGYEWDLDLNKCVPVIEAAPPTGDNEKPSVPQNLRITGVTSSSISLAWDAATDNVEVLAYKIFFKKQGSPTYAVTTRGLVANFQGFLSDTLYSFYVKSVDTSNNLSNGSSKVTARTLILQPPQPPTGGSVIYVDFNGGVVSGTLWNTNGDIVYEPSGMTITEEDIVIETVKQEYAAYNVLVTTDKTSFESANPLKRTWIIVTETWEWFGQAGGVAYIGSMFWGDKTPGWVFSSLLGYFNKYVAEACSHETGHTIGLRHQSSYDSNCIKTAEYNSGNSFFAPVMGVSYYSQESGFIIGPSSICCTCIQDDNQIIISKLGIKP